MTDYLKALMSTLEIRRMRTALEIDPETEESGPVLTRVVIAGKHQLIHPSNFIEALEEQGQVIDPFTLEIFDIEELPTIEDLKRWGLSNLKRWGLSKEKLAELKGEKPESPTPAPKTEPAEPKTGLPDATPPETPAAEPTPSVNTWSKAELTKIGDKKGGYSKLRTMSKLYDDVAVNLSSEKLIEAMIGKPKP